MRQFEIFKPGTHTSASGHTLSFGEDVVERSISVYDPAVHEAPIVVGHPKDNGPAYGWVDKLEYVEGAMVAHPKDVADDFAELVKAGRFKKRSASFYAPNSPNHPLKGTPDHDTYYLRHVGFLGAAAPAVKGLKDVAFSDEEEGVIEFEEATRWAWNSLGSIFRGLREWLIETSGLEQADKALPNYLLSDIEAAAREAMKPAAEATPALPAFNAPTEDPSMTLTPEQIADLQAKAAKADQLQTQLDQATGDLAKARADFSEAQRQLSLATIKDQLQAHVKAGRILPSQVDHEAEFIASLDDTAQTFDFTEGEGAQAKAGKETARARYLRQIGLRAPAVDFSERAPRDKAADEPEDLRAVQQKINDQFMGRTKK